MALVPEPHQKISFDKTNILRNEKPRNPLQYMDQMLNNTSTKSIEHPLSQDELVFEFLLNALRLRSGFTWQQFERNTGLACTQLMPKLQALIQEGLLVRLEHGLRCSESGYQYLDNLLLRLLPEAPATS